MEINYKIGEFELSLDQIILDIRKGKLSIYNVPISSITEQFLTLLDELKERLETDDLSYFQRGVCELLYIKSASLLPQVIEFDDEAEEENLKNRVIDALEKLKFSKYLVLLERYKEEHSVEFNRDAVSFVLPYTDEELLKDIRLNDLCIVYNKLMEQSMREGKIFGFTSKINSQEKYSHLLELFESKDCVTFTELIGDVKSKEHITCAFWAILIAINYHICTYTQDGTFSEIYLYKNKEEFDTLRELEYAEEA